jgi:tripartite-type tricarboxylate transporter receptor subunit TctC
MRFFSSTTRSILAGAALATTFISTASAQADYPNRSVSVVVPQATGGANDTIARIVAAKLSEVLGQQFVVENRPGAGGNIGTAATAKAKPDGYTLLLTTNSTQVINPWLYKTTGFDPLKDFTPVGLVASAGYVLVVNSAFPANNVAELIAQAKANPGKINFASSGVGSSLHLSGELFKQLSGIDMVHIPYKGAGALMPHLMSGTVDLAYPNLPTAIPLIKQGQLKALGVTTNTRSNAAPNIPTIAEAGLPNYDMSTWYGLVAPANLPPDIQKKLSDALMTTLKDPEFKGRLIALGMDPRPSSPQDFAKFIQGESNKWGTILKDMKFSAN